jgi:hypothetical protein
MRPAQRRGRIQRMSEIDVRDQLSVVVDGGGVAELWSGSALLGILHDEPGGVVLRLESHASGPLTVSAVALERALAEARERLAVANRAPTPP